MFLAFAVVALRIAGDLEVGDLDVAALAAAISVVDVLMSQIQPIVVLGKPSALPALAYGFDLCSPHEEL